MLRAARQHTVAHLHFLLAELRRYQRLSSEVTLAIIHIDDLTDLMDDLHVHGHPLFVSLQDARLQLVAFQRNCYQAIKMTLQRLENLFQRHWREKWVGGKWIHGTLITQLIPLAFLCDKTVVTDWADGRSTFRVTPLEKESGCVIWLSFTCMSISADCILLDVLFHCWLVGHS